MPTDKIQTGIRLPSDTLNKITYIAKQECRTLNSQFIHMAQKCIDEYEKSNGEIMISTHFCKK